MKECEILSKLDEFQLIVLKPKHKSREISKCEEKYHLKLADSRINAAHILKGSSDTLMNPPSGLLSDRHGQSQHLLYLLPWLQLLATQQVIRSNLFPTGWAELIPFEKVCEGSGADS